MCGIAGILDFNGPPIEPDRLHTACTTMKHRGPDDSGTATITCEKLSAGLASVRLAVQDPTPAGHQPFQYHNGRYLLAFNGEIYNYRELRRQLEADGLSFTTNTDTEVVAAACAHWGKQALNRFNGMFAFAFIDKQQQQGIIARDRFGIKPLLTASHGNTLYFASEMPTLKTLGQWDQTINNKALLHYLYFGFFAAPDTLYTAAHRLAPGHYITFDSKGHSAPKRYYSPIDANAAADHPSYTEACQQLRQNLSNAVARRRIADVPLGAFLSGGLDSAIIATHLAEHTAGPIKTFSIGYAEHGGYDETHYARLMADHLGSEHYELRLRYKDILDTLPRILDHLGEPFFDSSILPTAIVSQLAREHVTVCLSGDAGDELFGGYWRYLGHNSIEGYLRLPRLLRKAIIEPILRSLPTSKSSPLGNRVRQFRKLLRTEHDPPESRHLAWARILSPEAESILKEECRENDTGATLLDTMSQLCTGLPRKDYLNRIMAFDLQYGLPSDMLHKVDIASMYHSLEVRVPFLDPDVVATAMACPSSYKIHRGLRKRLLIDAYRGRIPDPILDRTKMGFEVPIGEFLRNELRDLFHSKVTPQRVESFGLLDYNAIQDVYKDHCQRKGEHADLLFALLSLCW